MLEVIASGFQTLRGDDSLVLGWSIEGLAETLRYTEPAGNHGLDLFCEAQASRSLEVSPGRDRVLTW